MLQETSFGNDNYNGDDDYTQNNSMQMQKQMKFGNNYNHNAAGAGAGNNMEIKQQLSCGEYELGNNKDVLAKSFN